MGELEERIQQVLNDPAQMAELSRLAQSLMGGADGESAAPPPGPGPETGLLGHALPFLREDAGEGKSREGLLRALAPYLAPKRRERLERALRLTRLGRLAQKAMGEE